MSVIDQVSHKYLEARARLPFIGFHRSRDDDDGPPNKPELTALSDALFTLHSSLFTLPRPPTTFTFMSIFIIGV